MEQLTVPQILFAGVAGTVCLTTANEVAHRIAPESPRLDVLGMRALVRGLRGVGAEPPRGRAVPLLALAGDLLLNAAFYSVTLGRHREGVWLRGVLAGVGAGLGALSVAPLFGLNHTTGYHWGRRLGILGLYTLGGMAAGSAACLLSR